MKKLCSTNDEIEVNMLKSFLDSNGIGSAIKNELLSPLAGGIPFNEVRPELWVHENDLEKAKQIISSATENDEKS